MSAAVIAGGKVTISADVRNFLASMDSMQARLGRLSSAFKALSIGAAGALAAFAGGRAMGSLAENAIDMERRLAEVRRVTDLSAAGFQHLAERVFELSTSLSGVNLMELIDVSGLAGRLGIAGDEIEDFVKDVANVGIALDDIPADEFATSAARIINVMGLGTDQVKNLGSALVGLDLASTATGRDILDLARRISGPAATLGLSPQKLLALSAALKDAGANNEVAGTAMAQLLGRMATSASSFAIIAGRSMENFERMLLRDPLSALRAFLAGLNRLDELSRFQALKTLGIQGVRLQGVILQLSRVMGKLNEHIHTAENEWDNLNALQRAQEIKSATTAAHLQRLGNAVTILAADLGAALLPTIKKLTDSILFLSTEFDRWLGNAIKMGNGGPFAKMAVWAERIAVIFQQWNAFFALLQIEILEFFLQVSEVSRRVIIDALSAVIMGFAQLGSNLGKAFARAFATFGKDISLFTMDNLSKGVRQAILEGGKEGLRDLFKNLPNLEGLKAPFRKKIDDALEGVRAEQRAREEAAKAKPAEKRQAGRAAGFSAGKNALLNLEMERFAYIKSAGLMSGAAWAKLNPEEMEGHRLLMIETIRDMTERSARRALSIRRGRLTRFQDERYRREERLRMDDRIGEVGRPMAAGGARLGMAIAGPFGAAMGAVAGAAGGAAKAMIGKERGAVGRVIASIVAGLGGGQKPRGKKRMGGEEGEGMEPEEGEGAFMPPHNVKPQVLGLEEFIRKAQEDLLGGGEDDQYKKNHLSKLDKMNATLLQIRDKGAQPALAAN